MNLIILRCPIQIVIHGSSSDLVQIPWAIYEIQQIGRTPITKLYGLYHCLVCRIEIQ